MMENRCKPVLIQRLIHTEILPDTEWTLKGNKILSNREATLPNGIQCERVHTLSLIRIGSRMFRDSVQVGELMGWKKQLGWRGIYLSCTLRRRTSKFPHVLRAQSRILQCSLSLV